MARYEFSSGVGIDYIDLCSIQSPVTHAAPCAPQGAGVHGDAGPAGALRSMQDGLLAGGHSALSGGWAAGGRAAGGTWPEGSMR